MFQQKRLAVGAIAVAGLSLAFFLTYWDRFLGPSSSGIFVEFASLVRQGKIPYRDFFMVIPPLYTLKTAALMSVFGAHLIVLRLPEVITRCALAVMLFIWLARVVRVSHAVLGAVAAVVMFSTDSADALTSYHHEAVFWAFLSGFLLSFAKWDAQKREAALMAGAGACCSLSLLTAQTTGAGITLAMAFVIAVLGARMAGISGALTRLAAYAAGWAVPAGALALWLGSRGALGPFLNEVFISGPSSKGSLGAILGRVIVQPFESRLSAFEVVVAVACGIVLILLIHQKHGQPIVERRRRDMAVYVVVIASALAFGLIASRYSMRLPRTADIESLSLRIGFFGTAVLAIYYTVLLQRWPATPEERQRWLLTVVGFTTAYMLSFSWSAYGPMAFPSLGIVIAFAMKAFEECSGKLRRLMQYALVAATACLLLTAQYDKAQVPFGWVGWTDPPVRTATATSEHPFLSGVRMGPEVKDFTQDLNRFITQNSRPGEPVFIFSYQPMFYFLSNRWPPTFAQVHWFDVAPDSVCREDAQRLVQAKPAVIVDFVISPSEFEVNERIFRHGARSGQRDLYDQMHVLIAEDYHLGCLLREPGSGAEVRGFVRNLQRAKKPA